MNTINRWTRRRSEGRCAYCAQPAVTFIPVDGSDHVCITHALEFWRGLLAYTRHRQGKRISSPFVDCPERPVRLDVGRGTPSTRSFPLRSERNATAA